LAAMDFPHVLSNQTSSGMRPHDPEAQAFAENLLTKLTQRMTLTEDTTESRTTMATTITHTDAVDEQQVSGEQQMTGGQQVTDEQQQMMYVNLRMKRMLQTLTSDDLAHIRESQVSTNSNPYRFSTTYIDGMIKKLEHNQNMDNTLD